MSNTTMRSPLVPQHVVARKFGMSWSEARAFCEAEGVHIFERNSGLRTWGISRCDFDKLAAKLGIADSASIKRRRLDSVEMADLELGHPRRRARRRRGRGSSAQSA